MSVRRVFFIYLLQFIVYEIDFSKVNNFKEKKYAKIKKNVLTEKLRVFLNKSVSTEGETTYHRSQINQQKQQYCDH